MAISKNKVRLDISMHKESADLISKFAEALHYKTKSEFIEQVCVSFIKQVVDNAKAQKKEEKKGMN